MRKTVSRGQHMVPCHLGNLNAPRVTLHKLMHVLRNIEVNFDKRLLRSGNTGPCYFQGDKRVMTFFRIWITYQSSINSSGGKENPCRTPLTVKVSIYSSPVHFTQKTKYFTLIILNFSALKDLWWTVTILFWSTIGYLYVHKLFHTQNSDHAWPCVICHSIF